MRGTIGTLSQPLTGQQDTLDRSNGIREGLDDVLCFQELLKSGGKNG